MKYADAIWNFYEPETRLVRLVEEFAGFGFDTISFLPNQVLELDQEGKAALKRALEEHSLGVTLHGNPHLTPSQFKEIFDFLEDRILCLTLDAAMRSDSRGAFFDTATMTRLLLEIEGASRGSELRFGIEDFPLDQTALDFYRADLQPLLDSPRYGILVDLGHMNLRLRREDYYRSLTVEEYLLQVPLPIIEVHVHDNSGERDEHHAIGRGNLPFEESVRALRLAGFDGVSTIEVAPCLHGGCRSEEKPDARASLVAWRRMWEE